VSNYDSKKY